MADSYKLEIFEAPKDGSIAVLDGMHCRALEIGAVVRLDLPSHPAGMLVSLLCADPECKLPPHSIAYIVIQDRASGAALVAQLQRVMGELWPLAS